MKDDVSKKPQASKVLKLVSVVWLAFLCIDTVLLFGLVPARLSAGAAVSLAVAIISITIAILNFTKYRRVLAGVVVLMLGAVVFTETIFTGFTLIHNPFTSQQFAAAVHNSDWLHGRGTITYYRRVGPVLYDPYETEYGSITRDPNYLSIDNSGIYVNVTFMGAGAEFEQNNESICLSESFIREWKLYHESYSAWEGFTMKVSAPYILNYIDSDGKSTELALTELQYKALMTQMKTLLLADLPATRDKDTYDYYSLDIKLKNDDASYSATVDGNELFSLLKKYLTEES